MARPLLFDSLLFALFFRLMFVVAIVNIFLLAERLLVALQDESGHLGPPMCLILIFCYVHMGTDVSTYFRRFLVKPS